MVTKPHGNSKRDTPFQRLLPSTRDKLKYSIRIPKCRSKDFLDEIYHSSGDVINVRSMNELPRSPSDLYNARDAAKKLLVRILICSVTKKVRVKILVTQYRCYFRRQRETKALQNHSSLWENAEYIQTSL